MILTNGIVMDENFTLKRLDVEIEGEKIVRIGEKLEGSEKIDMNGMYILPGFIDTHIHGAYGTRVSDKDVDMEKITTFEATQGVTAIAITTASSEFSDLLRQLDVAKEASEKCSGTKIAAVHAEGPFLSKKYKGAMNENNIIIPDTKKLDEMIEHSGGLLKIITIAPENENSEEFIKYAVSKGITVSMGHTNANYDEANKAIAAGASRLTHTFNAMRGLHHREPGVLGASFNSDLVECEMICDYVHLHPAIVKLIYKIKGADRINMISDSGHAAGVKIDKFVVDGLTRYVCDDGVVRLEDGTISGSARTLADGVKNLITDGIPIEDVSKMSSYNPAKSLKIDDVTGSIAVGKCADIVVLDKEYNVAYTYINGECVYKK